MTLYDTIQLLVKVSLVFILAYYLFLKNWLEEQAQKRREQEEQEREERRRIYPPPTKKPVREWKP